MFSTEVSSPCDAVLCCCSRAERQWVREYTKQTRRRAKAERRRERRKQKRRYGRRSLRFYTDCPFYYSSRSHSIVRTARHLL